MATIPNKDPVPSNAPRNLKFNAEKMDEAINSKFHEYTDRLGVKRKTWSGIESDLDSIITSLDTASFTFPDVIAGLAGTTDGQYFRVINGNDPSLAFTYYRKTGDAAVEITSIASAGKVESLSNEVDILIDKTEPLENSGDSILDIVTSNGLRVLRIREDLKTELTEVVTLQTGDSGLNFSGNAIDNTAPPGWAFVIHSVNGLIIAGVKDDGTAVGFGGGDNSGGQSGEIIPGDTAATYDAIRQYSGPATVKDVVGNRIAGRFVVDAGDKTSPDDGGGCLVGTDGRRWKRQADYVSYDMFGAPRIPEETFLAFAELSRKGDETAAQALLADHEAADTAMVNCHSFANFHKIPVVQNSGHFLWTQATIIARTDSNLRGSTIVTTEKSGVPWARWGTVDGVNDGAPDPVIMYRIQGKARIDFSVTEINELNTTYSSYLRYGSMRLPMPKLYDYRGGYFGYISSAVELYRSGNRSSVRHEVHYRDFTRIGRNGSVTDMFVKNTPAGTVSEAWIQPKESSWLSFSPPAFFETGADRKFVNVQIERSQVQITDLVMENWSTGDTESRVVIGSYGVTDIELRNATAECIPNTFGGAYVICFRNSIEIRVDGYYGLHGWGFQGHHGVKRMFVDHSVMNRFNFHSFGYDIFLNHTKLKGKQINAQGGGTFYIRNMDHYVISDSPTKEGAIEDRVNYLVNMREDYAGNCDAVVSVDGLIVHFDREAAWGNGTTSYDVIRMNAGTSASYGIDTKNPPKIMGRNITFDLEGMSALLPDNFAFIFCRLIRNRYSPNNKTYLPGYIKLEGMSAINVPGGKNAIMAVFRCADDMATNPTASRVKRRPDGTNADIIAEDVISVINNPVIAQNASATVYMPGSAASWDNIVDGETYRNSEYSWRPKVHLRNCYPSIINAPGVAAEFDIHGGLIARYVAGSTGNRCRITGADIQLIPDASGNLYFDSQNVRATGCDWRDPMNGATYSGTLRGIGNENRGTVAHSPNI